MGYLSDFFSDAFLEFLNISVDSIKKLSSTLENATVVDTDGKTMTIKCTMNNPDFTEDDKKKFIESKLADWSDLVNTWLSDHDINISFDFGSDDVREYKWVESAGEFFKVEEIKAENVSAFSVDVDESTKENITAECSVAERVMYDIDHDYYGKSAANDLFDVIERLLDEKKYSWRRLSNDTIAIISYSDIVSTEPSIDMFVKTAECDFLYLKNRIIHEMGFGDVDFVGFPDDSATIELHVKSQDKIFS